MKPEPIHLGNSALVFMGLYLLGMIGLGFLGRSRRRGHSLKDFYLAGSGFGFIVLFLTLFATQYSGNTLLGFSGRTYRQGASYINSVTFMILVISCYMIYAPRLYRLAKRFGYITPADFIYHRFGSHALRVVAVILLCWGLGNYILEQLVAMGHAVQALSDGRIGFMTGVVILACVMLVYESLGGMRSVAWTDVAQGMLLLTGCSCILYLLLTSQGGLPAAAETIMADVPERFETPGWAGVRSWTSNLILFGLGIAIYPHAIQRLFAARTLGTLRRSLGVMAFMPLVTTLLAFMIGLIGLSRFPGLSHVDADKITVYVMSSIGGQGWISYWLVIVVLSAVVAAIMSTADSALLSIGSMVTKDIYKTYFRPEASPEHYLKVGKVFGWVLMAFLILFAWVSIETESSIFLLIKLKVEFMIQLSPAFMLGVFWRRLPARAVLLGVVLGTAFTLVVWGGAAAGAWETRSPWGISAGVWGLAINYGVCIAGGLLAPDPAKES